MKQYYSIGEISSLFHIPIKTLRYYNDIGLLVPAYVKKESKFRYYTIEQFIIIDIIQNAKLMGMSLEEIKQMVNKECSLEDMVLLIRNQIMQFEEKIKELKNTRNSMNKILEHISQTLEYEKNVPFIAYTPKRYYKSYQLESFNIDDQEINLRHVISQMNNRKYEAYAQFGIGISYELYQKERMMYGKEIRYYRSENEDEDLKEIPEGNYLTIIFDDSSYSKGKYYNLLMRYVKEHDLKINGDFNEVWIMPRITSEKKETTLIRLDICLA